MMVRDCIGKDMFVHMAVIVVMRLVVRAMEMTVLRIMRMAMVVGMIFMSVV